jgi:hypothetical protein
MLKFDFDGADQNAAIFKMSKSVRLKLSEMANTMTATSVLKPATPTQRRKSLPSPRACWRCSNCKSPTPNALKLANAIVIKQDGSVVSLTLSVPSSELIDTIKQGQKKAEEKAQAANTPAEKQVVAIDFQIDVRRRPGPAEPGRGLRGL